MPKSSAVRTAEPSIHKKSSSVQQPFTLSDHEWLILSQPALLIPSQVENENINDICNYNNHSAVGKNNKGYQKKKTFNPLNYMAKFTALSFREAAVVLIQQVVYICLAQVTPGITDTYRSNRIAKIVVFTSLNITCPLAHRALHMSSPSIPVLRCNVHLSQGLPPVRCALCAARLFLAGLSFSFPLGSMSGL